MLPKETYYFCQFHELPKYDTDMHLISYEILNEQKDKDLLHHIVVHECDDPTPDGITNYGKECGYVYSNQEVEKCLGGTTVLAWVSSKVIETQVH